MKINYLQLFFVTILTCSFNTGVDQVDEMIRIKLENAELSALNAFDTPLHCTQALKQFYQKKTFQPVWKAKHARELMESIQKVREDGLNPLDYHLEKIQEVSKRPLNTVQEKADYELLLSDAFLLLTSHLLAGKVNPKTINAEWHVTGREGQPADLLERATTTGNINETIQLAMPKHEVYTGLKKALMTYRNLDASSWLVIAEGVSIKKGMEDERIPLIRQRLRILGELNPYTPDNPSEYDDSLFVSMQRFQQRHGLDRDGVIGAKTIAALNIPRDARINQLIVNLERWRWLPLDFGNYYIKVNIADYNLEVIKDGKLIRSHKVIVGKPARKTPVFSSKLQYLVFNPTWTIPPGILRGDVLPATRKDVGYLKKKNIQLINKEGKIVDPATVDWNSKEVWNYTYRQPAGADNALGKVKFMFPNSYHVYLHDTPSKELFEKSERDFSSGCIRVQNPLDMAEYLIGDETKWNRQKIDKVITTGITQTVKLNEQPNVYLLYWTAWMDASGDVYFRNDVYGRDMPIQLALLEKPGY